MSFKLSEDGHTWTSAVVQTDNVAIAAVQYKDQDGEVFYGEGDSKRAPGDPRDGALGRKLAMVRALQALMDDILESEGYYFED